MISKEEILNKFKLFSGGTGGIDSWLSETTREEVFKRLSDISNNPLSSQQLNQLLILSHEAGVSYDFFDYYWLCTPNHPYDVKSIPDYQPEWINNSKIVSLEHLRWGLYRLYVDSLLFFGNIRSGYRFLRDKSKEELDDFFHSKIFDTQDLKKRGPSLPLNSIPKDDRYLISEMACKSYGSKPKSTSELKKALLDSWKDHQSRNGGKALIRDLLDGTYINNEYSDSKQQLLFSADEILDE
ncbi:MAG: hypothetical protein KAR20_18575, partial [Candidatus Heimdallarchaeota archaeon]|nr:hypothetical protein [Candidatus Heimdallarchaeota archaeon]